MEDAGQEGHVHLDRLLGQKPALDQEARGPQPFATPADHLGVRIAVGKDHALNPGFQDPSRAGRRPTVMVAGLERDVDRAAAGALAGSVERHRLRVLAAGTAVPAGADDLAALRNHCPHHGVRRRGQAAPPCQDQRPSHRPPIGVVETSGGLNAHGAHPNRAAAKDRGL